MHGVVVSAQSRDGEGHQGRLEKGAGLELNSKVKGKSPENHGKEHSRQKDLNLQRPLGPENRTSGEHICAPVFSLLWGSHLLKRKIHV